MLSIFISTEKIKLNNVTMTTGLNQSNVTLTKLKFAINHCINNNKKKIAQTIIKSFANHMSGKNLTIFTCYVKSLNTIF